MYMYIYLFILSVLSLFIDISDLGLIAYVKNIPAVTVM